MVSPNMRSDFDLRLNAMAGVIVRIGLNLQPGQPLLISDPYELQGIHPETAPLIEAIRSVAPGETSVITADPARLRALVEADDLAGFAALVAANARRMREHLAKGGAFLFLPGAHPHLLSGLPADRLSRFDAIKWQHLGPLIQRLIRGASQWTLVPVPTTTWAAIAFKDLAPAGQLNALWESVFQAMRVSGVSAGLNQHPAASPDDPIMAWQTHLAAIARRRDELNAARHRRIRYIGPGTELTLELPRTHVWCTAQLKTKSGVSFVVNLPTEEIFTAPHKRSATGRLRLVHPVTHGGAPIEGIELLFRGGRVTTAMAATNNGLLQRLLATDDGADRIGEVALVPGKDGLRWSDRCHHHTLLDENARPHVALGDAYRFCSRAFLPLALNSSQIHLDLPLDAKVELL
ncbi:MAG TPA: aminopeptidase [Lacunisphaera sp.]